MINTKEDGLLDTFFGKLWLKFWYEQDELRFDVLS